MKKILVPMDFSTESTNAFRFALDIANKSKGEVDLLHVIELPVLHDSVLMPVLSFEEQLLKDLKASAIERFDKMIAKWAPETKRVNFKVQFGHIHQMIHDYVRKNKADLVVMGTKGAGGVQEMVIGSNAEKIVRRSKVPVLSIKKYQKIEQISNIVFPNTLDTEDQEDLVLRVKELQNFFKAAVHIVWINTPLIFKDDVETRERLNAFAKRFMFKNYTINIFNYPNEEKGILHFTQLIKGDLIALGTHGRTGFAHVIAGSLAEDVVNHVAYPVWTYSLKEK